MKVLMSINAWLVMMSEFGLGVALLFGLVAFAVKNMRRSYATYLYFLSFLLGIQTWLISAVVLFGNWGFVGLFIGIFLAGLGVVPVSLLSMMFHGQWFPFLSVLVQLFLLFGCRLGAIAIAAREAKRQEAVAQRESDDRTAFLDSLANDMEQKEI